MNAKKVKSSPASGKGNAPTPFQCSLTHGIGPWTAVIGSASKTNHNVQCEVSQEEGKSCNSAVSIWAVWKQVLVGARAFKSSPNSQAVLDFRWFPNAVGNEGQGKICSRNWSCTLSSTQQLLWVLLCKRINKILKKKRKKRKKIREGAKLRSGKETKSPK